MKSWLLHRDPKKCLITIPITGSKKDAVNQMLFKTDLDPTAKLLFFAWCLLRYSWHTVKVWHNNLKMMVSYFGSSSSRGWFSRFSHLEYVKLQGSNLGTVLRKKHRLPHVLFDLWCFPRFIIWYISITPFSVVQARLRIWLSNPKHLLPGNFCFV